MEKTFEGSLDGREGTFDFAHSATTSGSDRASDFFVIVPTSGTGELSDSCRAVSRPSGAKMQAAEGEGGGPAEPPPPLRP
ncbi:DUF3224 domain-containing protein [Actinacidiphila glaucinigra]|uniref:DUF3224 domain-containing protein n=1 Tax=Actinacidiphila glaucinigra TaxID=235986 RepID=UPI0037C51572